MLNSVHVVPLNGLVSRNNKTELINSEIYSYQKPENRNLLQNPFENMLTSQKLSFYFCAVTHFPGNKILTTNDQKKPRVSRQWQSKRDGFPIRLNIHWNHSLHLYQFNVTTSTNHTESDLISPALPAGAVTSTVLCDTVLNESIV